MKPKIAVIEAKQSRAKQSINYIRGYAEEPSEGVRQSIRCFFEKKQIIHRRFMLNDTWPTLTKIHKPSDGVINPQHHFYYGTPTNFARWKDFCTSEERIMGVAIFDEYANVIWYSPPNARHGNLLSVMHEYVSDRWQKAKVVQGFLTSHGRFLDRHQALLVASKQNQLIRKTDPIDRLFSEDLFEGCI